MIPARRRISALVVAFVLALGAWIPADAARFGKNKVRYRPFEWQVLRTDHFEVHYYPEEQELAYEVCHLAEKAWQRQTEFFRLSRPPQRRVPIFLYATFHDFIQTNVSPTPIDEGVGGFTEVFKTRVVLPLSASREQRKHVIEHELVHAHQFFILYGEGMRSYSLYKSVLVPLWFMEGMAEHVVDGWNARGEMVLRDAVLHDRLPPLWQLHSFNHLEPHDAYLGYKAGQSALDFLSERYGEDKIPAILKGMEDARTFGQVFSAKTGVSLKEFDGRWRVRLKETYWSQVKGKKDARDYGVALVANNPKVTGVNSAPTQSPQLDVVAFLSDRSGVRSLYLMRRGKRPRVVFSTSGGYRLMASPPAWSPDGRHIVVVAKRGPRSVLLMLDARKGKVKRVFSFPFLDIGHPRFSPDGTSLAFAGFNGKTSELYIANLKSGGWKQLTRDGGANAYPAFTPDSETIIYSCESDDGTVLKGIRTEDGADGASWRVGGETPVEGSSPDVSQDGRWILFESGRSGVPNLYACGLDGKGVRQVTDARTGIYSGKWARDGRRILAVSFENGSQNIYLLDEPQLAQLPILDGDGAVILRAKSERVKGRAKGESNPRSIPSSRLSPSIRELTVSFSTVSRTRGRRLPWDFILGRKAWAEDTPPHVEKGADIAPLPERRRPLSLSAVHEGASIVLSWSGAEESEKNISRYAVYRSTNVGLKGRLLGRVFERGVSRFVDTSWRYETAYYYRVRAGDSRGEEMASGRVKIRVPVEIWPEKYRMSVDSRLVDLFVLVGSITVGGGTNFAGYGLLQLSDLPGDHRFLLQANAVPGWSHSYGFAYQFGGMRPNLGVSLTANSWSQFVLVQNSLSTESFQYPPVVTDIVGAFGAMSYPLSRNSRFEVGAGFEQFTEVFAEDADGERPAAKRSRLFPVSAAFVRDTSRWRRLLPVGGGRLRMEAMYSLPMNEGSLHLSEYSVEGQYYIGLSSDACIAMRWWGALSTAYGRGNSPRTFYLGGRYSLRAHPVASLAGNLAYLGNHEFRFNLLKHININLPLLPILLTDIQGLGFVDVAMARNSDATLVEEDFRPASVGGGVNIVGFMFQAQPVVFSIEVARRMDERQGTPTIYGRLGPLF